MVGIPSPFGGGDDPAAFDDWEAFVPEHLPEPGPFLADLYPLTGEDHVRFHRQTRGIFEERTVYDMTFDYNLARLNLDPRHPDAGYRYAVGEEEPGVLFAEFTPTTPFCPQSETLTVGSFRAWNGLADRHDYDAVRVRVHPMHHEAVEINHRLESLQEEYEATGEVPDPDDDLGGDEPDNTGGGRGPTAPF